MTALHPSPSESGARVPLGGRPDARELASLRRENLDLQERLAWIESEVFGASLALPVEWKLTGYETRTMMALLAMPIATRDAIMTSTYRDNVNGEAEGKVAEMRVHWLRRKLAPFGITIRTVRGVGYAIDDPQRSMIRKLAAERGEQLRRATGGPS